MIALYKYLQGNRARERRGLVTLLYDREGRREETATA